MHVCQYAYDSIDMCVCVYLYGCVCEYMCFCMFVCACKGVCVAFVDVYVLCVL